MSRVIECDRCKAIIRNTNEPFCIKYTDNDASGQKVCKVLEYCDYCKRSFYDWTNELHKESKP